MDDRPDPDRPDPRATPTDQHEHEYADLDPDTITEDAIEFFEQDDDSPASDAEAAPPG